MAERVDIGSWSNPLLGIVLVKLYVDDGVCDVCHESKVVVVGAATNPMFGGHVCAECIMNGLELFAIKNKRQMPVLMYKDTLGSTV